MSLYDRFELLGLDRDDGVKTFEAREITTSRPVKVHLFVQAAAPLQVALLKAIDRLPDAERQRIIDRGRHEGTPYIVTDRLVDYPGLTEWVQAASSQSKPKKAPLETAGAWKVPQAPAAAPLAVAPKPPTPVPPSSSVNQQFADLFATKERPILPDTLVLPPKPAAPVASAPAAPPPASAAPPVGEFTRMFQTPAVPTPVPPSPVAPTAPQAPPPGEFTRMFQAPVTPSASTAAPPAAGSRSAAPPSPASKDFENFFDASSPAGPMPQSPAVKQPLAPQAPGGSGANKVGEFTRMFGKVDMAATPPAAAAPPAAPKEPGEFTRMFQAPVAGGPTPPQPPAAPLPSTPAAIPSAMQPASAPPPPAFSKPAGPGEYTRQFSAPVQLTLGQTSATPSVPAPPPAFAAPTAPMAVAPAPPPVRKSNLPLMIGIAAIVLIAVLVVIFFAMRPK